MTTVINASPSNGLVQTADGSGVIKVQSNGVTTNALAWVNYNAAGQAIRSSYNVSSVTYNSTGKYTVNFTNALTDANYAVALGMNSATDGSFIKLGSSSGAGSPSTSSFQLVSSSFIATYTDYTAVFAVVFGN